MEKRKTNFLSLAATYKGPFTAANFDAAFVALPRAGLRLQLARVNQLHFQRDITITFLKNPANLQSSFKHVRNPCDIAAINRLVYTRNLNLQLEWQDKKH